MTEDVVYLEAWTLHELAGFVRTGIANGFRVEGGPAVVPKPNGAVMFVQLMVRDDASA